MSDENTRLLKLSNGHLSLEIGSADEQKVMAAITHLYGKPEIKPVAPFAAQYVFGGAEFVFYNEWDDPCFIAASEQGDRVLQSLFAAVTR